MDYKPSLTVLMLIMCKLKLLNAEKNVIIVVNPALEVAVAVQCYISHCKHNVSLVVSHSQTAFSDKNIKQYGLNSQPTYLSVAIWTYSSGGYIRIINNEAILFKAVVTSNRVKVDTVLCPSYALKDH